MKTLYPIITLLLLSYAVVSPAQTAPRTEYTIQLSEQSLSLIPGETKSVGVQLARSRNFSRYKAELTASSTLPAGLTARFEPATGLFDVSTLYISAPPDLKPGQYQVVVRCDMGRKLKATVLTLHVGETKPEIATN